MDEWKGLIGQTISLSNIEEAMSTEKPSIRVLKDCANESGIKVEELAEGAYEFSSGNITRRIGTGPIFDLENIFASWLCANKYATFELLRKRGFQQVPYYQRYSFNTIKEARQDFMMRNRAVVIKPCSRTSGGLGVTVNIRSIKHLNRAIFNSLKHDHDFLMEDFIEGDSYRILFFKDKMIYAAHRLPANVKGDGVNTIRDLIRTENEIRIKERSNNRLPIVIDNDVKQTLLNKKISFNYVPAKDEVVYVRSVCNRHVGGEVNYVTSIVHPDIIRECERVMSIMCVTLGGIDIITKDITKPLDETGGVINEVNTSAGLPIRNKDAIFNILNLMFERNMILD